MIQVVGSLPSPYVRMVRIVLKELELPFELIEVPPFKGLQEKDKETILKHNPIQKVPTLLDGGQEIWESRVIIDYLLKKYSKSPLQRSIKEENRISVVLSALDTAIQKYIILGSDPTIDGSRGYFARMNLRLDSTLAWLESHAIKNEPGSDWLVSSLWIGVLVEWFEKRKIRDLSGYKNLQAIRSYYSTRKSFQETTIPE
jgi:glutathione S-transferase